MYVCVVRRTYNSWGEIMAYIQPLNNKKIYIKVSPFSRRSTTVTMTADMLRNERQKNFTKI